MILIMYNWTRMMIDDRMGRAGVTASDEWPLPFRLWCGRRHVSSRPSPVPLQPPVSSVGSVRWSDSLRPKRGCAGWWTALPWPMPISPVPDSKEGKRERKRIIQRTRREREWERGDMFSESSDFWRLIDSENNRHADICLPIDNW